MIYSLTTADSEKKIATLDIKPKFFQDHFEIMGQNIYEADVPPDKTYLNFELTDIGPSLVFSEAMDGTTIGQFIRHPILKEQIFVTNDMFFEDNDCNAIASLWAEGHLSSKIMKLTPVLIIQNAAGEKLQLSPSYLNTLDAGEYTMIEFSTEFQVREDISFFLNRAPVTTTIDLSANSLYTISAGQDFTNTKVGVCDTTISCVSDFCIATR